MGAMALASRFGRRIARAAEALTEMEIAARFGEEKRLAGANWHHLEGAYNEAKPGIERTAVGFLIRQMPAADLMNVNRDFVMHHVRESLKARAEFPWGRTYPDAIFLSYVVPWRASPSQPREMRDRLREHTARIVAGAKNELEACDMIQAFLDEKNGFSFGVPALDSSNPAWDPARNPRGRNPPSTYMLERGKRGLCGEYTHMFTMMCRSVGIPMREVSIPRSDMPDTHAWAEAWTTGAGVVSPKSLKGEREFREGGKTYVGGFQPINTWGTWARATKEWVVPYPMPEGDKKVAAFVTTEFERDGSGGMREVNITGNYLKDSSRISARCSTVPCTVGVVIEIGLPGGKKAHHPVFKAMATNNVLDLGEFARGNKYLVLRIDENWKQLGPAVGIESLRENTPVNVP